MQKVFRQSILNPVTLQDKVQKTVETNAVQLKTELQNKLQSTKQTMAQKADSFKKKLPDTKQFNDHVIAEANELYVEIQNDPTLKHICDAV